MTTSDADSLPPRTDTRPWVLLGQEAATRGFKNALAFRRWLRRHDVTIRTDGRFQWVCPSEVDRTVAALADQTPRARVGRATSTGAAPVVTPVRGSGS